MMQLPEPLDLNFYPHRYPRLWSMMTAMRVDDYSLPIE
jgi:hypothetical protein